MAGLSTTTQHEAGRHASKLWRSRYFSLPWPTCGGVESNSGSLLALELDKMHSEESESPQTASPSRTPVDLGLQRTPTVQSRSSGSNHISTEPLGHPTMVVIRMEPEPEPIRIRGGGCCGGGTGGSGGSRMKVDPSSHAKGAGVPPPTEKPNIRRVPTPAGNDQPGKTAQGMQPADSTKPTQSKKPAKPAKPTKHTKPAEPTKPAKPTRPTQPAPKAVPAQTSGSTLTTQAPHSGRATQPAQSNPISNPPSPTQPTPTAEPVGPTPTSQTALTASSTLPTQMASTQPAQPGQLAPPTQLTQTAVTGDSLPGDSLQSSQIPLSPRQPETALEEFQKTGPGPTGPQPQQKPTIMAKGALASGQPNQKGVPAGTTSQTPEPIPKLPPSAEAHRLQMPLPTPPPQPETTSPAPRQGLLQPVSNPSVPVPASSSRPANKG